LRRLRVAVLAAGGMVIRSAMAGVRFPEMSDALERFAAEHDLVIATIADLIGYRSRHETLVHCVAEAPLNTRYGGEFRAPIVVSNGDALHTRRVEHHRGRRPASRRLAPRGHRSRHRRRCSTRSP
jgi:hypothetical protein